jgi:hypothetical protein
MFMGVMAGGRQAVFALRAGVQHAGPGTCRPRRTDCAAILLKAGQTEHVTIPPAAGAAQSAAGVPAGAHQLILRSVRITGHITHSRNAALAAYERRSGVGLCELDLANPVSYSQSTGTLAGVAASVCKKHPGAVPFSYLVTAP